jgi:hypothetical protein
MNIYMVLWVRASIRFCACSCHFNAIGFPYVGLSPLGLRETRWAMEMKLSCWVHLVELAFCLSRTQQDNFISIAHLGSLNPSGDRPT